MRAEILPRIVIRMVAGEHEGLMGYVAPVGSEALIA
jgi:hypothetical protein